jgi:elongation factor P
VFMDPATGEQFTILGDKIGDDARWLSDGMNIDVTLHNSQPIGVDLPANVTLQITACEPGIKGDTASGATKPATLSTGAVINVPLFVKEGEWVKVDTADGKYLERVNR